MVRSTFLKDGDNVLCLISNAGDENATRLREVLFTVEPWQCLQIWANFLCFHKRGIMHHLDEIRARWNGAGYDDLVQIVHDGRDMVVEYKRLMEFDTIRITNRLDRLIAQGKPGTWIGETYKQVEAWGLAHSFWY